MNEKPGGELTGPRFEQPVERRDFFGLAAVWTFFGTLIAAMLGALKLPMPSVFPEADSRFPVGTPKDFTPGMQPKHMERRRLYVFCDEKGVSAVSTVCPHLSCVVTRHPDGTFTCPCHGSKFDRAGAVKGGPSPRGLVWIELSLAPDGRLIADSGREVEPEVRFSV